MEFAAPGTIKKYVSINVLAGDNAYFIPANSAGRSIQCRFLDITDREIRIKTTLPLSCLEGTIYFFSYHLLMSFSAQLWEGEDINYYYCLIPEEMTVDERRHFPRVRFESSENKAITIHCRQTRLTFQAILFNLSAGGVGFYLADMSVRLEVGQTIIFNFDILGIAINRMGRVQHIEGSLIGCKFLYVKSAFVNRVHQVIFQEIEWRSDRQLVFLEEKKHIVENIKGRQTRKEHGKKQAIRYYHILNSFLEFSMAMLHAFLQMEVRQRDVRFEKIPVGDYRAVVYFEGQGREIKFQFFLCFQEQVLLKAVAGVLGKSPHMMGREVENVLIELGRMIAENASKCPQTSYFYHFTLSPPLLLIGENQGFFSLSPFPGIRVRYDSPAGEIEVVVLADKPADALLFPVSEGVKSDICNDRDIDLHDALYNAIIDVFSNFLQLDVKEIVSVARNPHQSMFEASAIQEISCHESSGNIVLNVSRELTLSICQRFFHQHPDELAPEPVEVVGEILKRITEKTVAHFREQGKIITSSAPFILKGHNDTITNMDDRPFVTSHYRTPAGEFELGYSTYRDES